MGRFIFQAARETDSSRCLLDRTLHRNAYLCGIEGVPFQTDVAVDGHRLTLQRRVESSAKLLIPYWIDGIGYRTITSCSLRPTGGDDPPYDLAVELARGSCMTARNQSDLWSRGGLVLDDEFQSLLADGTEQFIQAATDADPHRSQQAAERSIATLQQSIDVLSHQYAVQSIAYRSTQATPIGTMIGAVAIPPTPTVDRNWERYQSSMNCVAIRTSWADVETDSGTLDFDPIDTAMASAEEAGMRVIAGPIIDFRARLMPHWLYLLENDFEQLVNASVNFVERVVQRYRGRIALWNAASALNTPGPLPLSDQQAMRLTVSILGAVRRLDPATPAVISFDQPFGEYLAANRDGISPMHFADAIARSGLGLSGLGLEYRMGYTEGGTLPRSSLDVGNSIERWATLGMPLLVTIGSPGDSGVDHQSVAATAVTGRPSTDESPIDLDAMQLRVGGAMLRTLLAKPCVHGVLWDGWDDSKRHVYPHAGLIDPAGDDRRMLEYFRRLKTDGII